MDRKCFNPPASSPSRAPGVTVILNPPPFGSTAWLAACPPASPGVLTVSWVWVPASVAAPALCPRRVLIVFQCQGLLGVVCASRPGPRPQGSPERGQPLAVTSCLESLGGAAQGLVGPPCPRLSCAPGRGQATSPFRTRPLCSCSRPAAYFNGKPFFHSQTQKYVGAFEGTRSVLGGLAEIISRYWGRLEGSRTGVDMRLTTAQTPANGAGFEAG